MTTFRQLLFHDDGWLRIISHVSYAFLYHTFLSTWRQRSEGVPQRRRQQLHRLKPSAEYLKCMKSTFGDRTNTFLFDTNKALWSMVNFLCNTCILKLEHKHGVWRVSGVVHVYTQIEKFMGPTWGPPVSCRPQMVPMLAPWTLLSGHVLYPWYFAVVYAKLCDFEPYHNGTGFITWQIVCNIMCLIWRRFNIKCFMLD